jgi:GTP cyclohydrolase I
MSSRLEQAGALILEHFHLNYSGVQDTPRRYAKALKELLRGYESDPLVHVKIFDNVQSSSMIIQKNIHFFSMCEHHMLPFFGVAHVGYIPKGNQVIGLSKLARIFDCFACRLQVQERIGEQFVDFIETQLQPLGVICKIEAEHLCVTSRGVRKEYSKMVTTAIRGCFVEPDVRSEFFTGIA